MAGCTASCCLGDFPVLYARGATLFEPVREVVRVSVRVLQTEALRQTPIHHRQNLSRIQQPQARAPHANDESHAVFLFSSHLCMPGILFLIAWPSSHNGSYRAGEFGAVWPMWGVVLGVGYLNFVRVRTTCLYCHSSQQQRDKKTPFDH